MQTRDILNYLGTKIGELTLDDGTSESKWAICLSAYAQPPTPVKILVENKIKQYSYVSDELVASLKADNTLAGITTEQSAQMFDSFGDVLQMLREGAFPTAIYRLSQKTPSGFVTQPMIDGWIKMIQDKL